MSVSRASTRMGLFALLLSVIVLSLFGSLLAADRALSSSDRASARLDARGIALLAERELRLHAAALGEAFGPLTPTGRPADSTETDVIAPAFQAVWIVNSAGALVWRRGNADFAGADSAGLSAIGRSATPAVGPSVRIVGPDAGGNGALLLTVPLVHREVRLGAAVALLTGMRFLQSVQDPAIPRAWIRLRAGNRDIAGAGIADAPERYIVAQSVIAFPGDQLTIEVAHAESGRSLRTALWLLAVTAVAAMFVGLWRERRQGIYLAGRTAELERLYQEVARSNRMKSEFLANVSHELRTPLNAVVGFVEMLREGVYGELTPRQALPVDRIAASATHLRHLVDRLLDIAKIAAGRLEIHPEPLVLRPFVLNVASEMESLVSERGLALSIAVGPALPRIRTDQTHLRQILINLIGNAVKYTHAGGIQVRARLVGNGTEAGTDPGEPDIGSPPDPERLWMALQVGDTGVGIAPADRERIFDEFEQVNAGARADSARRGTGLGLAISRRLARLLGGELTVVSEVAKGSVFTVWLPVDATERKAD